MLMVRLISGIAFLLFSMMVGLSQSHAQSDLKQLKLKNCFGVILGSRMTSLPIKDSEIRPLTFAFKATDSDNVKRAKFISSSCSHHLNGEVNGFSKALYKLFEYNNITIDKSLSARFEQVNESTSGLIFLATFNLWLSAHNSDNINKNGGYLILKQLSKAGDGNASLQLYNFFYKNKAVEANNAIIEKYFNMASQQGNNYAKNNLLNDTFISEIEGSDKEKVALQNLFNNIKNDITPFERGLFAELCADQYVVNNFPKLNEKACHEANKNIFPVALIDESKLVLGGVIVGQEQMRSSLDNLITALEHDDKIYFNPVGKYNNRTQALILLSQIVALFNINQLYEGDELNQFIEKYKLIMFDEDTLIDINALPFAISSLLTADGDIDGVELSSKEIDLLKIYADYLLDLNKSREETCRDLAGNSYFRSSLWPEDLPVISTLKITSATIEDFENYGDGAGFFQIDGTIRMMDPSKLYRTLLVPNFAQNNAGCDIYLSDKSVALYPPEINKNFEMNKIVVFPQGVSIKKQSGYTKLEKSAVYFGPPSNVEWKFSITDKININPDLSNFPFQIGDVPTGIIFNYGGVAHGGIWSRLVDDNNNLLPSGSDLPTSDQLNNNIKASFQSSESNGQEDLAIKIAFKSEVDYYLLRIIFPSAIFVLLSVLAVLSPTNKVADLLSEAHLQVSTTVLVALVAYQFIIDSELPKLPYYTALDAFLYCLLFSSALSIMHNLLPHISSSNSLRFRLVSRALKYGTILFFVFAILNFIFKYFGNN